MSSMDSYRRHGHVRVAPDTVVLETARAKRRQNVVRATVMAGGLPLGARLAAGPIAALNVLAISLFGIALLLGHLHRSLIVTPEEIAVIGMVFRRRQTRARVARIVRAIN